MSSNAYNPHHTQRTLLYRRAAEHFETWLELASADQFDGQGDHHTLPAYGEKTFRKYLECGIFAHGRSERQVIPPPVGAPMPATEGKAVV